MKYVKSSNTLMSVQTQKKLVTTAYTGALLSARVSQIKKLKVNFQKRKGQ